MPVAVFECLNPSIPSFLFFFKCVSKSERLPSCCAFFFLNLPETRHLAAVSRMITFQGGCIVVVRPLRLRGFKRVESSQRSQLCNEKLIGDRRGESSDGLLALIAN